MMEERFEAIVVGAGPAGSAAACVLARAGVKVLVLERGEYPGAKNVMGGILYPRMLEEIVPGATREAPLERPIVEQQFWMLTETAAFKIAYRSEQFRESPTAFSVLRARFDPWFAGKAVEAGALLVNETLVEDLIWRDGRVVGVRTGRGDGDVFADVVIVAAGVNTLNSLYAGAAAGCRGIQTDQVALAVKEVIALPPEKIEERFCLPRGQGVAIELIGDACRGLTGTAFIYTNRDSVSIGVGAMLSDLARAGVRPYDLLEHLKNHPMVRPLIEGGETREYLAHLIPEGGYYALPRLYDHGLLVCGDAAMLVNSLHREGSNLAMTSGRLAAETVLAARARKDYSRESLSLYRRKLEESFVLQDLKHYRRLPRFLEQTPALFTVYPKAIDEALREILTVDGVPKAAKLRRALRAVLSRRSAGKIVADLYRGGRALW